MRNLLLELLLFEGSHAKSGHLLIKLFPILPFLLLKMYHLGIPLFNKILSSLNLLLGGLRDSNVFVFIVHVCYNLFTIEFKNIFYQATLKTNIIRIPMVTELDSYQNCCSYFITFIIIISDNNDYESYRLLCFTLWPYLVGQPSCHHSSHQN